MNTATARLIRREILHARAIYPREPIDLHRDRIRRNNLADRAWLRTYAKMFKLYPPIPPKTPSAIWSPKPRKIEFVVTVKHDGLPQRPQH